MSAPDQHPAAPEGDVPPARCWYGEACADTRYCKHPEPTEPGGCRPPAAPSTKDRRSDEWLTEAEGVLLAEWWASEGGDHEDLALDRLGTVVERIMAARTADLRERLRAVEGERDAALLDRDAAVLSWSSACDRADTATARAESSEAALAALRAGVDALAAKVKTEANQQWTDHIEASDLGDLHIANRCGDVAEVLDEVHADLRELLAGDGR